MGREEKPTVTWNHVQGAVWRGCGVCGSEQRWTLLPDGKCKFVFKPNVYSSAPHNTERALKSREETGGWRQDERRAMKLQKGVGTTP